MEYIESSGTQYIDTGIKGASNVKMYFEGAFERTSPYVTGSRNGYPASSDNSNAFCFFANTSNEDYQFYKTSYNTTSLSVNKIAVEISKNGIYLNNTLQHEVAQDTWNNNYNITIFAVNTAGNIQYGKNHKIYIYRLYKDGALVRNLIPCYRKSDGVIGLYDMVTKIFYTNAGSGTFTKGADV